MSISARSVREFIGIHLTPYDGDESFLVGPTEHTVRLWGICKNLLKKERENGGTLSVDPSRISTITSHEPGYIDRDIEIIVGLQTDAPLKRSVKPMGGIQVVSKACEEQGVTLDPSIEHVFRYRKDHNNAVFAAYTDEIRWFRSAGIITGLPDNYARWRIIGDYRRVALYGTTSLITQKEEDKKTLTGPMTDEVIRLREEVADQIAALSAMTEMAATYGYDISRPAENAYECVQWSYFAYLAALKEHDGAAMSLGNVSGFFDIFIERDIQSGKMTESEAQELIDQFVIKLRLVRHLRMHEYDAIFAGDPTWLTESIGGVFLDGQHKVTKTSYRFLHTLYNLWPSPEPNLTVLWSEHLPETFKRYCAKVSIDTSSIQYENDDLMREVSGCDDYGISCCVSQLRAGDQMQYFGARCNIAKTLLLTLNGGHDELSGKALLDTVPSCPDGALDYTWVWNEYKKTLSEVVRVYVDSMNIIHAMHDRYYYERAQMALLDTHVDRLMAFGVAGLSVVADSLSAIRYARVTPVRDEHGITIDFITEGDYPKYGNDDDRVDSIAKEVVEYVMGELRKQYIYRSATPTLSVLTITSNVLYGKKTGTTPDGRRQGEPFAPGANPMHGRDTSGVVASLLSVAKIPYEYARDGVSYTCSMVPRTLGATDTERRTNLVALLSGYFTRRAQHLNVNVLDRTLLERAMAHPEEYPQLTIRVSGYAVHFTRLTSEQQREVIARTFFEGM